MHLCISDSNLLSLAQHFHELTYHCSRHRAYSRVRVSVAWMALLGLCVSSSRLLANEERIMLPLQDLRTKLLAQQRDLFRQVAQTEDDLYGSRRIWNVKLKSAGRQKQWFSCSIVWMSG